MVNNRYAAAHANPKGAGDARPTADKIVEDEGLVGKLQDKTIVITGCSSGIGLETTRALFKTGARLFLTARNLEKAREALKDLPVPEDKQRLQIFQLDQTSLDSVRTCADEINRAANGSLNIMICNAGVWRVPEGRTKDGFETQWGVNHLSHFLLFQLLKPCLLAASTPAFNSRVVVVSSMEHREAKQINWENVNLEGGQYDRSRAYAQSKLANIYMANEIERRYGGSGLRALAVHPGGAATGIQKMDCANVLFVVKKMVSPRARAVMRMVKSPAQAAATQVWAAVGRELEGVGGKYLEECQESEPVKKGYHGDDPGYESFTYNEEAEEKCWIKSCEQVGFNDS
ncbi:short-chain dehydrogenase/reductase-like protein [Cadophora sp. DSE1049]|nr:short-chain dehydrogenase/reductase-like protein [Cadophora sp. DSE1049]